MNGRAALASILDRIHAPSTAPATPATPSRTTSRQSTLRCQMCEPADAPVVKISAVCTIALACAGGMPKTCNDDDACTNDSCEPSIGCLFDVAVESPECDSCADGIDNDGDGVIDAKDPGCHTDGNADNPDSYDPNDDDETDVTVESADTLPVTGAALPAGLAVGLLVALAAVEVVRRRTSV